MRGASCRCCNDYFVVAELQTQEIRGLGSARNRACVLRSTLYILNLFGRSFWGTMRGWGMKKNQVLGSFFAVGVCLLISVAGVAEPIRAEEAKIDYAALVRAITAVESGGNPRAIGLAGERGLMQIKLSTWREI